MKIAFLAWILAAASSAQAAPGIALGSATSFTSGKSVAGVAFEAAGHVQQQGVAARSVALCSGQSRAYGES